MKETIQFYENNTTITTADVDNDTGTRPGSSSNLRASLAILWLFNRACMLFLYGGDILRRRIGNWTSTIQLHVSEFYTAGYSASVVCFVLNFSLFSGVGKSSLVHLILKGSGVALPAQKVGCTVGIKVSTFSVLSSLVGFLHVPACIQTFFLPINTMMCSSPTCSRKNLYVLQFMSNLDFVLFVISAYYLW